MASKINFSKDGFSIFYEALQALLLLGIRFYFGLAFIQSGWGKFQNIPSTISFFESIHIPFPFINAYLVALVECFAGLFLIFGFQARLAAFALTIIMCVAYLTAHFDLLQSLKHNPLDFFSKPPFSFLFASLLVLGFGPGLISLDNMMHRKS